MRLTILLGTLLLCGVAHADDRPWAAGVPEAEQTAALALYQAGNDEFVQQHYTEAMAKYREALKHWDHPGVQFNLAVCLIQLDQPVEAFEHLERALRFGEAALGADKLKQGEDYRKQLLASLARIDVTCTTPNAQVTLDGQQLAACPTTRMVAPGQHQLVGRREGYSNSVRDITTTAGATTPIAIELEPLAGPTKPPPHEIEHHDTVEPQPASHLGFYVMGAGGAVAVTAIAFDFLSVQPARDKLTESSSAYDTGLSSFKTRRNIDIAMFVTGGVAIAAGAYLQFGRRDHGAVVTPVATTTSAMVSLNVW